MSAVHGLLLFGCIGLDNRSYSVMHGLAGGLNAAIAQTSARLGGGVLVLLLLWAVQR